MGLISFVSLKQNSYEPQRGFCFSEENRLVLEMSDIEFVAITKLIKRRGGFF